jgi:Tfp pilus assembly protein PilF
VISDLRLLQFATIAILLALALIPHVLTLVHPFVYDDLALVVENDGLRSLEPVDFLKDPSVSGKRLEWYRPLTLISLAVNYRFSGLAPFAYHLTNLLLHALNVFLVYRLARRLGEKSIPWVAAGVFAVHAVHVEAIAPVSGRADLLATNFALVAWYLSMGFRQESLARLSLVTPALLGALLAKESALGAWPVALILAAMAPADMRPEIGSKRWYALHLALAAAAALYFLLRWLAMGALLVPADVKIRYIENPLSGASILVRMATSFWILCRYLFLLVFPARLSADYSYNQVQLLDSVFDPRLIAVLLLLPVIGLSLRSARRGNQGALLALSFLLLWLPISNLPVTIGTLMAERLLYLPSVPLCLLLGCAAAWLRRQTSARWVTAAAILLIGAHAARSFTRVRDWSSQEVLFATTARTSPESAKARFNYGSELYRHRRITEARRELEAALAIAPGYPEARSALAAILLGENKLGEAEQELRRAIADEPLLASAWANLGMVLFRARRHEESAKALERALELQPRLTLAWMVRGAVAEQIEGRAKAIDWYQKAYELEPDFEGLAEHLAKLLREEGREDEAERVTTGRGPR